MEPQFFERDFNPYGAKIIYELCERVKVDTERNSEKEKNKIFADVDNFVKKYEEIKEEYRI